MSNVLHSLHSRTYEANRFVYPVLSRRSKGISIGVNLNPDKVCNFDCIYCQVDRRSESETKFVWIEQLLSELDHMLEITTSGKLYEHPPFSEARPDLRRLNDIAFAGDGEPTTFRNFDEIMARCAEVKRKHGLDQVKMVLITNATMFHRPVVQAGLSILDQNNGEIWGKLDAGTSEYYHLIDRTTIPFQRILDNLLLAAKARPIVIQSLFMLVNGEPPSAFEIDEYVKRLKEIVDQGGQIKLVQVYTVARRPTESYVKPLSDVQVDAIAQKVREGAGLSAECYYGRDVE
jgi:wyosine [tRNA(Phe)-imidazoG37] synthetase (radical SAM superfamily)